MIRQEQKFGIVSTLICTIIMLVMLMFFGFSTPYPPPEEEGILINFGTDDFGEGLVEPKPASQPEQSQPTPQEETISEPVSSDNNEEQVMTQDFDQTAAIEEQKRKKKEKKLKEEQERKRLAKLEQERIEREKAEQERKAQEQKQKEINARAAGAFGGRNPKGDNTGEGDSHGKGNQGSPEGDINSKNRVGGAGGGNGISFNLNGRSSRSLPAPPKIHQTEGRVVVEVTVDQNGNVISARPGVRGTTITDANLLKVAKEAALKAKFNMDKNVPVRQKGTITYLFGFE